MNPISNQPWTSEDLARWGIRGMDDFSNEELARLQQKVEGWIHERAPQSSGKRRRTPFVVNRRVRPQV
jgi:hypothetical protein